jgi:hypothetical protein
MPRIRTEELLNRLASGDFTTLKLRVVSGEVFVMLLECEDGTFIHENNNGEMKEYPKVDNALSWLRRTTKINEIFIDIAYWRLDS